MISAIELTRRELTKGVSGEGGFSEGVEGGGGV